MWSPDRISTRPYEAEFDVAFHTPDLESATSLKKRSKRFSPLFFPSSDSIWSPSSFDSGELSYASLTPTSNDSEKFEVSEPLSNDFLSRIDPPQYPFHPFETEKRRVTISFSFPTPSASPQSTAPSRSPQPLQRPEARRQTQISSDSSAPQPLQRPEVLRQTRSSSDSCDTLSSPSDVDFGDWPETVGSFWNENEFPQQILGHIGLEPEKENPSDFGALRELTATAAEQRHKKRQKSPEDPQQDLRSSQHPCPTPQLRKELFKTELCANWQQGKCPYESRCNYAHGQDELRDRIRPYTFKTYPCIDAGRPEIFSGGCSYGSRCNYAHPGEVMRTSAHHLGPYYQDEDYFAWIDKTFPKGCSEAPFGIFI
eukprot:g32563.t1